MQTYQTRHLEALTDVPLGGSYHAKGVRFHATQVDAEYLVRHGKAKNVDEETSPAKAPVATAFSPPPQLPPDTAAKRSPGRPSNAELAARREAAAEHAPGPPPADSLVMTTRDVPMPGHS